MVKKSRGLRPDFCFAHVTDVPIPWLTRLGIHGLLIDVDNTITRWELLEVPEMTQAWLRGISDAGIECRLLSNGLAHKRRTVAEQTGIAEVGGALFKPLPGFYRLGLKQMGLKPEQVMMIGDSVLTDIAGANRLGIWTALVDPLGQVDFVGTKIYRGLEYLLRLRRPLDSSCDYRNCVPDGSGSAKIR